MLPIFGTNVKYSGNFHSATFLPWIVSQYCEILGHEVLLLQISCWGLHGFCNIMGSEYMTPIERSHLASQGNAYGLC